jgi:hypothetical protein
MKLHLDLEDGGSITDEGEHGVDGVTERSTYASEEVRIQLNYYFLIHYFRMRVVTVVMKFL